jgi:endo-cleaving rubber dioxygenase
MTELSRRNFLRVGGTVGALSAISVVAPRRAWAWSARGSLAGSGAGVDPSQVWDSLADPVVAKIYKQGQRERVNRLLAGWTTNDQLLPDGLPAYVVDFIEEARQLPSWVNWNLLQTVGDFYKLRGQYLGILYGLGSGMMSTAIPNEARAVYYSQGGAEMKDRIAKTSKLGYDVGALNAYQPSGEMIVTAVKTRMIHSAVRYLLPQSRHYPIHKKPISKADILITWHSLATYSIGELTAWNVSIPQDQSDAFLHLWQVTAHMLGVEDEYIPATWADATAQRAQLLDPVLGPTPEGTNLAQILLNLACEEAANLPKPFVCAFTRYLITDRVADYVQIPSYPEMEEFIAEGWPSYIKLSEGLISTGVVPPDGYWMFDEILRQAVLFYFNDGERMDITLPCGNRTNFTSNAGNTPFSSP